MLLVLALLQTAYDGTIPVMRLGVGVTTDRGFGIVVAGVGDVDGDGRADIAVGDRNPGDPVKKDPVWVFSGRDGHLLWHDSAPVFSLAKMSDANGDGRPDVLVGGLGSARILSGRDGSVVLTMTLSAKDRQAHAVDDLGDLDGDSRSEVLVVEGSRIGVYSGRNGDLIREMRWHGTVDFRTSPDPVHCVGDVDGDGRRDIAMPGEYIDRASKNEVAVVSSTTFECVQRIPAPDATKNDFLGTCIEPAGDFDGDGRDDVLITTLDRRASVFSGKSGALLQSYLELKPGGYLEGFGASAASIGDTNGDGVPEIVVGCSEDLDSGDAYYSALFDGRSGRPLRLIERDIWPGMYHVVSAVGDVDGDGIGDVAIAVWEEGCVSIVSGRTQQVILELHRPIVAPAK